ncbi:hypothetical protein JSY36_12505 [Bacillus sp. H-16]|uniref:hypothetical protein n=1 Tax=Alteribacter salitolerans TaxID=2912333 RepID=UPI001965A7C3|nr:hypothetical protein [Alteribacter salitolerans]MBM7096568.1 hypothetical protein [Alteribacter salitolerans]
MVEIEQLKAAYGFHTAEWVIPGETLKTERGVKTIKWWENHHLMNWHIQWREALDNRGVCLTNRMIRTKDHEMSFLCSEGWMTLHDEVTSLFSYQGREDELAALIEGVINTGYTMDSRYAANEELTEKTITEAVGELPDSVDPIVVSILKKTMDEAITRYKKAERLPVSQLEKLPVIDPLAGLDNGKEIFGQLFWSFPGKAPEMGYRSISFFLRDYLAAYGKVCFERLLESLDESKTFDEAIVIRVLKEALLPWDFVDAVKEISGKKGEEASELLEKMYQTWEQSRALVTALSTWFDGKREKVAN